ncbi:MAG: FadR/GntR family transcriptional regulator [Fervidobacterium sp.]|uniref:FadR/GntR family transcriptional regulator n=1 Tax=Fervidobacterium sp. TaxID=1871331 RepID=UPI00404ABC7A
MFRELEKVQTSERIVEEIIRLLSDRKLKPGDPLPPERELAQELGVSRVALREAITSLALLGIVEKKWGKGNFISQQLNSSIVESFTKHLIISRQLEIFEIMEARLALESEIAAFAALRRTEEDIQAITSALQKYLNASRMSLKRVEYDKELHYAISKAAKNKMLESLQSAIMGKVFDVIKITTRLGIAYKDTEEEHERIVKAIVDGDPEEARNQMAKHIIRAIVRIFGSEKKLEDEVSERVKILEEKFNH